MPRISRTAVTHDTHGDMLRRLFIAAIEFRDLAPWRWMDDDQLIGVEDPASGEVGYGCVMGALGSMFGLAVYRGPAGYAQHQRLYTGEIDPEDTEAQLAQDCLLMSFEDRRELTPRDLRELASVGLKVRGRNAWPLFRSTRPGYLPWYLEPEDLLLLCVAVEQATDVCRRAASASPFPPPAAGTILMRRFDADRGLWRDCQETPPEPPPLSTLTRPSPEKLARLRARIDPRGPVSEVQLIYILAPIAHGSERPYLPRAWLCADRRTGIIAMSELMEPERGLDRVQDAFLALLEDGTPIPAEIRTADALSQALLAPIAEALGVRLRLVGATPRLAEAREAMAVMLRRGFADGPPWAD